jgi:GT2 family glycosyltransferase
MRKGLARESGFSLTAKSLREAEVIRIPSVLSHRARPAEHPLRPVRRAVTGEPRVTIIVPFKDKPHLLRGLWESLLRHDAGLPWDLVLVSNNSVEAETFTFLEQLRDRRVSWFEWNQPYNWSAINNAAAASAQTELLLFMNNDMAVISDGWLRELAGFALDPEIGIVGARLRYEDDSLQHAGVVIGLHGLAGHIFARWRPEYGPTPFGPPDATRNWSAVTGACQMIRRDLFERLGGFDEQRVVSGGDVELCLRVRQRGLRVVCVGHVELYHFESSTRRDDPVSAEDVRLERAAYRAQFPDGDPYFHPALALEVATAIPR